MYDTIYLEIRECDLDTPISFKEEIPCYIDIDNKVLSSHADSV